MKRYRRYLCLTGIAAMLGSAAVCCALPQASLLHGIFYNANELFKKGDYPSAAAEYEKILGNNAESGNLYYNIGNAYFKMGKLGKAVVNYERAQRLIPRDSDCRANLAYALSLRENPLPEQKLSWFMRIPAALAGYYTLDELTVFVLFLYVLLAFVLSAGILWKKFMPLARSVAVAGSVLFLLAGAAWVWSLRQTRLDQYAIVVVASSEAKFAPEDTAVTYFKVYEGAKVKIVGSSDRWLRVKTPDAKLGWVPEAAIERL